VAERQAIHPVTAAVEGERLIQLVRSLAEFGALPGGMGVDRQALTPDDLAARRFIVERARAAGAAAFEDEAGSFFLRWPGQYGTPAVATGSHVDSQPSGGSFDGAYGVCAASRCSLRFQRAATDLLGRSR
jgi:N-carbamoyl-L-amino-acid hydrolase